MESSRVASGGSAPAWRSPRQAVRRRPAPNGAGHWPLRATRRDRSARPTPQSRRPRSHGMQPDAPYMSLPMTSWFHYTTRVYNGVMALVFTFPCGGCGRTYSVYYPKALLYQLSGTAPREMGLKEDEEEVRSGAVDAARTRAGAAGRIFVDASQAVERVCACASYLDCKTMYHHRAPPYNPWLTRR